MTTEREKTVGASPAAGEAGVELSATVETTPAERAVQEAVDAAADTRNASRSAHAASSAYISPGPRSPADTVSWGMRVAAAWGGRFLVVFFATLALLFLLNSISMVTISIAVALMISALLAPVVDMLTDRLHLPRVLAASIVFIVGAVAIVFSMWFVISQITDNAATMGQQLRDAGATIRQWMIDGPLHLSEKQVGGIYDEVTSAISKNRDALISGVLSTASNTIGIVGGAVFCLFALLFMLFDDGSMWGWVVRLFPKQAERQADRAGLVGWRTLVAYMRSTVLLAIINALTMVIIMMIAGMPLVAPLGVLLFLGSLIPLIGMIVAGVIVVLIALVTKGAAVALVMAIALVLTVQLEGNLLNPYILGRAVQIHPLGILVGVTGGAILGGVFGAFVAVPLIAIVSNVVKSLEHQPLPKRLTHDAPDG